MTHILIPREPSTALLRPFTGCPADELPLAWAAMVRAAEVQNARAGAAPAAVEPQDVVAWMHPETLNVISAAHKHDMSTEYGAETRRKAESYSVALVRAGEPAAVAGPAHWEADDESRPRSRADLARVLDEWNETTGCIPRMSSWRVEVLSIIEDAFDLGMFLGEKAHLAPALEAPAAPAIGPKLARIMGYREYYRTWGRQLSDATELVESHPSHWRIVAEAMDELADALAAAPQAPAPAPGMAVTALAGEIIAALEADEKDGGYDLTSGLFGPKFSALVRRWAASEWASVTAPQAPAAPSAPADIDALLAAVRALPTVRSNETDGEESDGTPRHWRNRPFVSLRKLERLLRERVAAPAAPAVNAPAPASDWRDIFTAEKSDDLIWLYDANSKTIDGPRTFGAYDVEEYTHWAPAEAPDLYGVDEAFAAEHAAQAKEGGEA